MGVETRRLPTYEQGGSYPTFMKLDDTQKKKVSGWIAEGLKLAAIQGKLAAELGVNLTYMEVRLLVDDLKLMPKDPEPPKPAPVLAKPAESAPAPAEKDILPPESGPLAPPAGAGNVLVTLDQIARAGAMVSGGVTFSDGQKAVWHLDQMGRLGITTEQTGYKPSPTDVQEFQLQLQARLQQAGF